MTEKKVKVNKKIVSHKSKILHYFYLFVFTCFTIGSFLAFVGFVIVSSSLPDVEVLKNYSADGGTKVFSSDGVLLGKYSSQNRIHSDITEIPDVVKNAFLSAEDAKFYQHNGIDFVSLFHAIFVDLKYLIFKEGQVIGASTITQQVVKNLLLTNERTLTRKFKEIVLSFRVEKILEKDQILEIYLNHIFLGNNSYGVAAAGFEYFGKPLSKLEIHEAALLAAMPKAPSELNPRRYKDKAKIRRDWIIKQMAVNGYIDWNQVEIEQKKEISLVKHAAILENNQIGSFQASDYAISEAKKLTKFSDDDTPYIQTTIDSKIQQSLYSSFRESIFAYDKRHGFRGAIGKVKISDDWCADLAKFIATQSVKDFEILYSIALSDIKDGKIKAGIEGCVETSISVAGFGKGLKKGDVFGSRKTKDGYFVSQFPEVNGGAIVMNINDGRVLALVGDFYDRKMSFNRAIFAQRQPGSTAKPFVYATALENDFTPSSILIDEELRMDDEWSPENSSKDFLGAVTLRRALENSRNVPTIRLSETLGIEKVVEGIEKFGVASNKVEADYTSALGSFSTTVEKMVQAFAIFGNGGKRIVPQYIEKVQHKDGRKIYSRYGNCKMCRVAGGHPFFSKPQYEQVISPQVAYQITSILEGVVKRGTAYQLSSIAKNGLAGKTGTTNDAKDSWFIGFTNKYVIAVFVGYDLPKSLGSKEFGATVALPAAKSVLNQIFVTEQPEPFAVPDGIKFVSVDLYTGLPSQSSEKKIMEVFKESDKISNLTLERAVDLNNEDGENNDNNQIYSGTY